MTRFRLIAVDFLLMTLGFLLVNQAKRGSFVLPEGYGLRLFYYSRLQGFGTVVVLMALETAALGLYFSVRKHRKAEPDIESAGQVRQMLAQERYDLDVNIETVRQRLLRLAMVKLERSRTSFDLRDDYLMLRLNVHFLKLHRMLLPGGYFVGYAHTIQTHYDSIFTRFPRPMAHGVYALDFLVHRVAPKLPWVRKVYFAITKGNNRSLSRAEVLGRLCFCGFDIVASRVIDKRFYFIAVVGSGLAYWLIA